MSATPPRNWTAIADRFEVAELLDRYAHAIDTWDWDLLATVFTPDAVVDFSSVGQYVEGEAKVRGFDAIVAWYKMALAPSSACCTSWATTWSPSMVTWRAPRVTCTCCRCRWRALPDRVRPHARRVADQAAALGRTSLEDVEARLRAHMRPLTAETASCRIPSA